MLGWYRFDTEGEKGRKGHTIIRTRRLLDEPRLELRQLLHVLDRLGDAPDLIRIDHEHIALVVANNLSCNGQAVLILRYIGANLELEVAVPLAQRLLQQALHLILAIAQPARRRRVRRDRLAVERLLQALLLALLGLCEDLESLVGRQSVRDVSEVDQVDDLRGCHVGDDAPDGFPERLGPQVPDGVHDGAQGEVDDALLRADPAQLRVVDEVAPCLAPVGDERVERAALDAIGEVRDGGADDFVAAADCEGLDDRSVLLHVSGDLVAGREVGGFGLELWVAPEACHECTNGSLPTDERTRNRSKMDQAQLTIPCPENSESVLRMQ